MRLDQMIQFMKQVSGKFGSSIYASVQDPTNPHHAYFLKRLQHDLLSQQALEIPFEELKVVVFDLETTGFFPEKGDQILSIGAVKARGFELLDEPPFYSMVRSKQKISPAILDLTGLKEEEIQAAPPIEEVLIQFLQYSTAHLLVAHHSRHETAFLKHVTWKLSKSNFQRRIIDTSFIIKIAEPHIPLVHLEDICIHCGIPVSQRHHALEDAKMTAEIWTYYLKKIRDLEYRNLRDVYNRLTQS